MRGGGHIQSQNMPVIKFDNYFCPDTAKGLKKEIWTANSLRIPINDLGYEIIIAEY